MLEGGVHGDNRILIVSLSTLTYTLEDIINYF